MVQVQTPPKEMRIASTTGHVVILPANEVVDIPASIVSEACARGCVVVTKDYDPDPVAQEPVYGKEALDRKALNEVKAIIEQMIEDYKPNEWTKDNKPDAKAIGRRMGKRVNKDLRDKVYAENFNERSGDTE